MRASAPSELGAEVVRRRRRRARRGRAARAALRPGARPAARDRPHRERPGRDDPLPARDERQRRRGSRPAARTASSARCCRSGARRPRRSAASAASRYRVDSSNAGTTRGLIRDEILPLLERIHPAARENILRSLETRRTLPPALAELLDTPAGSRRVDLGGGLQAVREHDRLWLERGPVELARRGRLGRLAHPLRAARPYRARVEARRPARRPLEEDPGRVRRRQDPPLRP